jgi:hypothetical protein
MSFSSLNGSGLPLHVSSLVFPNGQTQTSPYQGAIYSGVSIASQVLNSSVDASFCEFTNLPAGNYMVSVPFRAFIAGGNTGNFISQIRLTDETNAIAYLVIAYKDTVGSGDSGVTEYLSDFFRYFTLNTPGNLHISFQGYTNNGDNYTLDSYGTPVAIRIS